MVGVASLCFVIFRINFLYNDLNKLLLNLNINNNDIKYLYKQFKYQRNQFIYLPQHGSQENALFSHNFDKYKEIINYFSNKNNNNDKNSDNNNTNAILRYILINNGIFTMMNKYIGQSSGNYWYGIDSTIYQNQYKKSPHNDHYNKTY